MRKIIFIIIMTFFNIASSVFALEVETHGAINSFIAQNMLHGFSLDSYLINQLGMENGKEEQFNSLEVWQGIRDGGKYEDKPPWVIPYIRSVNHFHNPLTDEGFSGYFYGLLLSGDSSAVWAQKPMGTQSPISDYVLGGNYSWHDTRDYFYRALKSANKTDRETYYAKTFRGIGQLMHLVEDMSVPAHTRDDGHVSGYHYELAVDKLRAKRDPVFINAIANPISFDPSILTYTPNPLAPIPIAKIFDTDQYNSAFPDSTVTAGATIGLSEYSNANFVSEGLLGANFQDFPYPRIEDLTIIGKPYTGTFGTYTRQYYKKNCCGETNGGQGYLLSAVDYLDYWRQQYPLLSSGLPKIPVLDDNVYKDYASLLLPRAVGYSAGLLNYFFRGKINIIQTGTDKFQIVNLSDEDMEGDLGSFKLLYDDINDNRNEIALIYLDGVAGQYTGPISIPAQSKSVFTVQLDLQSTPIINPKTPGEYILVFKGRLGNEGVAPYDTSYAVAAQLITPHFMTHVEVNGQWDIYEYDLLGNRVYNVTGELPRGIPYHHALPNPLDPDLIVFSSDTICPGNDPQLQVCVRILTRSTGALELAEWIRIPWWSKDGQRVYGVDGGNYNLLTGAFEADSPWNAIDDPSFCGYGYFVSPSLSHDESMLAIEGNNLLFSPDRVDTIIFTPNGQSVVASDIADMNTMTLAVTDNQTICNYVDDELFFDTSPDFHPAENRIIFASNAGGPFDIYETDFTTRNIQSLTFASPGDAGYYQPAWSPDGQEILFVGEKQGTLPEIYSLPSTGGTPVQITNDGVKHYYPRWMRYLGQ